jgi:flavin reductase (DIM6/NTAB) family NADH-FMN oxidoreductase RutF
MFYDPDVKGSHGLPHDPFKALVTPRPIGWISTIDREGGVNLAPYSFFNAVSYDPCIVFFSASGLPDDPFKHSRRNAEESGEFVCNIVPEELKDQMNLTSAEVPRGVDELKLAGLTAIPSKRVKPPRVAEAPAHLECRYLQTVEFESPYPNRTHGVVFGRVIGVHIRDDILVDGKVDVLRYRPLARMGYWDYTVVNHVFPMPRPDPSCFKAKDQD